MHTCANSLNNLKIGFVQVCTNLQRSALSLQWFAEACNNWKQEKYLSCSYQPVLYGMCANPAFITLRITSILIAGSKWSIKFITNLIQHTFLLYQSSCKTEYSFNTGTDSKWLHWDYPGLLLSTEKQQYWNAKCDCSH